MNKRFQLGLLFFIPILLIILYLNFRSKNPLNNSESKVTSAQNKVTPPPDPAALFSITSLRKRRYPESKIEIEQTLDPGINYQRYIASYRSDGLKIYGLFTVPDDNKPKNGYPAIVFLHGYLDPKTYVTTDRYVAYQDGFARNGFITFKPDLRGHGNSEGQPVNSNFSPEYVIDTLNLISALKIYPAVNPQLFGMWGHSNGGGITMRALEVSKDIKAAVIWAGVVGSYDDLLERYRRKIPWINNHESLSGTPSITPDSPQAFLKKYGSPSASSPFWSKIDPYNYIKDITAPVQLHHGTADESVPIELSIHFRDVLKKAGKTVELYTYEGADHNLADPAFTPAMERSVAFFKKYLQ